MMQRLIYKLSGGACEDISDLAMDEEIQRMRLEGTVDTCPVCGYTDGPHIIFKDSAKMIILICPQCHSRFDPDWNLK
ncbi:hypothetical protein BMS3Abin16_00450 [archaeon BMS3Abin16]|nr:hypothetical protein BMS3Abin16_00450 [archaeon BMS3Abin16]